MKKLAGPLIGLVLGLAVGFSLGQHQGFSMGMGFLETQVEGTLSMHVEAASCIRVGDTEHALRLLDGMIDNAVTSVVGQPGPLRASIPLSQAKLYRSVVPATGAAAVEVATALDKVTAMAMPPQTGATPSRSGLIRLARQSGV